MKMLTTCLLLFLVVSIGFSQQQSPNILLIIADDMGNDVLSGFGFDNDLPNTPTLDSLRNTGVAYNNCWAAPQCTPTRAAIMSGKFGAKTGVTRPPLVLDTEVHTSLFKKIAEQSTTDYSMAAIGKWHIGGNSTNNYDHPTNTGVPHFEGVFTSQVDDYYNWTKLKTDGTTENITEYATTHFTNNAISWIDQQTQPWFLWLAHVAPHAPFQIPPSNTYTSDTSTDRGVYSSMIESMDYEINRLIQSMDEETLENTIIIFIGDNGTPGRMANFPQGHAKSSIYEGGVRVPLIISGKSVSRQNEVDEGLVQATDLHATILELAGIQLLGGTYNSLSLKPSLTTLNSIDREINYTDYEDGGVEMWATRTNDYKLIEDENGNEEFYDISTNLLEDNNLIGNLTTEQETIKTMLQQEAQTIRNSWSCNDGIQNGTETTIDDCDNTCGTTDVLSYDNIPCCETMQYPSVYYEYVEGNQRVVYSNNYPNHDFCYVSPRIPEPYYKVYRFDLTPSLSGTTTSISRENGRPENLFGIALNGVYMMPAPATPFIFEDANTGEYNWDWVFEPTTNIGSGRDFVGLDCATAHVNPNTGYHYHGNMFSYVEELRTGISTSTTPPAEVLQVGWASDGFPILYRFGPDQDGNVKEMLPSFQLKSGLRPGDGISAPCGPYSGKYINDFEYIAGKGDLDECNGIEASVTLTTNQGEEIFEYYYVITEEFPQISRCMKGNFDSSFIANADELSDVDNDGDGFVSAFDCDDNNADINPFATDNPATTVDESCGNSTLGAQKLDLEQLGFYVSDNPNNGNFDVISSYSEKYTANLFDINGKLVERNSGTGVVKFTSKKSSGVYVLTISKGAKHIGTTKVVVK